MISPRSQRLPCEKYEEYVIEAMKALSSLDSSPEIQCDQSEMSLLQTALFQPITYKE
jgi:hypothetical protein